MLKRFPIRLPRRTRIDLYTDEHTPLAVCLLVLLTLIGYTLARVLVTIR